MTSSGASRKAKKLRVGDVVQLKGRGWQVLTAERRGDEVRLELTNNGEPFRGVVPADRRFELAPTAAEIMASLPLTGAGGEQQRWATEREAQATSRLLAADVPVAHAPDDMAPPELDPWVPSSDAERAVASIMGGTLLGAQLDGEAWIVPPVNSSTVMAHLLTFHATEPPSAVLTDVRTPMAEQLDTAAEALLRADVMGALTLHSEQHAAENLPAGATPHQHRAA